MNGPNDIFNANLRLNKVAVGAKLLTALSLIFTRQGCHHNNLNVFCFCGRAKNVEHIETANLRHHYIANY